VAPRGGPSDACVAIISTVCIAEDAREGWRTYRSPDYGFMIDYPAPERIKAVFDKGEKGYREYQRQREAEVLKRGVFQHCRPIA
jgi:hypothetical protein